MMNKIQELGTNSLMYKGSEYQKIPHGTIVKVVRDKNPSNGKLLMRTNLTNYPFISLVDGEMWGQFVDDYNFLAITHSIQIN